MKVKPSISVALRIASFFAAVLVVAIHANTIGCIAEPAKWNVRWHWCLCSCLNRWAVPFFFTLSGFWFVFGRYVQENDRGGHFGNFGKVRLMG